MTVLPDTMRAVVATAPGGRDVLELRQVPVPSPGPGEVLIRVAAAGVNPVDAKTRAGRGAAQFLGDGDWPWIPGWDLAGEVVAIGFGVARFAVGDRVFGTVGFPGAAGAYAEYAVAHVSQLSRSPRSLSDVDAAALAMGGLTAWQAMVDAAGLETNQRILITAAAGGVGHLAVQIAADLGAHVIAVASPANHDFLRGLGAHDVVDRTADDWTSGIEPVDVVLDGVGGPARAEALPLVRPGGTIVSLPSGDDGVPAPEGVRSPWVFVAPDGLELQLLTGSVERGVLRPHVSRTFPLAEAAAAHEAIESGGTRGKIVLTTD
ncbi:NADP-dependent oxidoreductase [Patulibacter sp. SYSU D01012]|uniref:NADP-dependent oxidoreductase n=1 Tax=Patulibacter sp. SYSU D01012 TaxID=2817381 RepID=UPI001B3158CA|nr:NADP-dependent oxidoreductase [Patulibacter sp. SYSU D01012]